jgi:hypothetical protein
MTLREQLDAARTKKNSLRDQLDAARLAKKAQVVAEAPQAEIQPEVEAESNWYDRPRAALQGMTMGFSDEIGAGIGAGLVKGAGLFGGSGGDDDYLDIYRSMMNRQQQEKEQFQKDNPYESAAYEVGGGLLTGGLGAGKVLSSQAVKNAPKLLKALAVSGVGATEGAIAGAGGAKTGEILENTAQGASIGALLPHALKGAGKVIAAPFKRRVQQELDGDVFTPLNQALPRGSRVQNYLQKNVAPSYGGGKLREQNRVFLEDSIGKQTAAKDALKTAKTLTKSVKEKNFRDMVKKGAIPLHANEGDMSRLADKDATAAVDELATIWKDGFKSVKDKNFTVNPKDLTEGILDDFSGVVDKKYQSEIRSALESKLNKGFKANTESPDVKFKSKGLFGSEKAPDIELDLGKMDGDHLMQVRNDFRIDARAIKDEGEGALRKHALNRTADKIDTFIKGELDDTEATDFAKDLSSWGVFQQMRKATGDADINAQGKYSPSQFLQSSKRSNKRNFEQGNMPFQSDAKGVQVAQQNLENQSKDKLTEATNSMLDIKRKTPNLNPTFYEKGMASAGVALPAVVATGGAALPIAPVLSPAISKLLSTQTAQKTLAGQTGVQKMIAELLRKSKDSGNTDRLNSSLLRLATSGD